MTKPKKFLPKYKKSQGEYINPIDENWAQVGASKKFVAPLKIRLQCAFWRLWNKINK